MDCLVKFFCAKCWVVWLLFAVVESIYVPNELDRAPRPYTTGIKIKTSHYKAISEPYYHSNYSKVYVHNKNYTSSFLDDTRPDSNNQATNLHPVYISEDKKDKMDGVLKEHNTNVVEKSTLNDRVVYKRRIAKSKNIEVFNKCPPGSTGQFVYDLSCNQFLDCWNGRGGPRNCAPGTLFNPKTLECDFPEKVECLTGPSGSSLTLRKSAKLQRYEQAKCPEDFSGLIPNYTDCSKFVQCNNGIETPRDCPPGTLFDTNLNVCNHAKEATCFSGQKGDSAVNGEYQAGQYSYGGQQQGPYQGQLASGCDPTNPYCKLGGYVISGQNIFYSAPCNPQILTCQENVAYIQPSQSKPTVYIQYVMCNPSQEDCSTFQPGTFKMGPGGALCDPVKQQCGGGTPNDLPAGTYFVKYVVCDTLQEDCAPYQRGVVVANYGVPGTLIGAHPVEDSHQYPTSSGHTAGQPCNPQYQKCGQPSPTVSPGNVRTERPIGAQASSTGHRTHSSAPAAEAKCPGGFQGVTKHPTNCRKFLNCANGVTYVQDCGPGTLFNPILKTCDFSYNVDCRDEVGVTTTLGYDQDRGEYEPSYGNVQGCQGEACEGRAPCQGVHCAQTPPGGTVPYQGQTGCKGHQCRPNQVPGQGQVEGYGGDARPFVTTTAKAYTWPTRTQSGHSFGRQGPTTSSGHPDCPGYHCNPDQGQGQVQDYEDEAKPLTVSSARTFTWPTRRQSTQPGSSNVDDQGPSHSHIMKIPTKKGDPINKSDRVTSGGFNNEKTVDYVDIFDPDETRNLAYAPKKKQDWPPPFPDLATTDPNADYVFEYEDGEPVTLAPENVRVEKRRKSRCGNDDFMCDKRSCVAKNFVCDGVTDCADGRDEKYCQKYLDDFKPYKNRRLDVLEKQRWDNVSYSTCALLCMDNRKFECKSFNYRKLDRTCFLTNENVGSSGALREYYPCDYYERKSTSVDCSEMHKCPNGKCLTSDQVCDGYDDCGDRADEKGCRPEDFGYSVRLTAGEEARKGRIEVTVFGKTGYICDDGFSITDADVLCKELGFKLGALEVKGNSFYAKDLDENHTLYMMDDVECLGNETSLMQCDFAGWGIHNCADREIAGVICKTPQETCSEGYWKCDTGNECVRMPFLCDGLYDCTDNSDEASHICDLPTALRLVNGSGQSEGRLEIRHHGIWGSVCDDDFNEDAAKIVCNTLGFSGSVAVKKDAYFGQSTGPIWLDQVSCKGNESSLEKCTHWNWGEHNCDHSEDVGIVCSNSFFIVEPKRSSKNYQGEASGGSIKDLDASGSSPEPVSCGYRKDNIFLQSDDVHFRVVQGSVAKPGDYPWQAALRIKGSDKSAHWCGAVVISSKWVLTAAHCLEGYPKGAYMVVAGEYNIDENEGTEQQAHIEEYYLHENFRQGHKMGNDIAMVLLKGHGFKLNQDIQPICLPDEQADYERDLNCTISGFGTVQTGRSAYSHKLRAAWIPIQKMDVCKMAHIYGENIGDGMICAGDLTGGVDACDGDSGGPLACLNDGVFTLYGITSWGQRCGYANKPGVYVKVSHYRKWIENIMKIHS